MGSLRTSKTWCKPPANFRILLQRCSPDTYSGKVGAGGREQRSRGAGGKNFPITNYQLPITNYQLPVTYLLILKFLF
ncbi:hypothetical protein FJR06_11070 [Dolichospermum sp. UHCC 0352]|nr:hypothetical protein [Dolichospermum sp. UHCC 0352]